MILSPDDYDKIRDFIYTRTGMALKGDKIQFLSRRVEARMRELDLKTALDYWRYLVFSDAGDELEELINMVVISETYFFREYDQLKLLAESILPLLTKEKGRLNRKELSVLSAGCATGEEPYTLAIILREMLDDAAQWRFRIDGVDINSKSIRTGTEGLYTGHALRETPNAYRERYFTRQDDRYALSTDIKEMVYLFRTNIFEPEQTATLFSYDIVFCRNVLIYFDRESAATVLEHLYKVMRPGGYIFLGLAESVGRLTNLFKMLRFGKHFVYQK